MTDYFLYTPDPKSRVFLILKKSDNEEYFFIKPLKVYGIIQVEGEYYEYSSSLFTQVDENISREELEYLDQEAKREYFEVK